MRMNAWLRLFAVIGLCFSMQSIALPEMNQYKGLVQVEDLEEDELREQALKQVLIKVSGNVDIANLEDSKALVKKIPSMLAQFGYQEVDNVRFYYALFDKRKINRALINMQQPVWGETRPIPLIWLVNDRRQITSEYMVNSGQDVSLSLGLQKSELKRGVKAQFPLIDLDDSLAITASDISGRFYQTAAEASKRYGAEYFVLANVINTADDKSELKWELIQHQPYSKKNQVLIKQTNNGSKSYIMTAMMNDIADYYAQQFAILENNGEKLTQSLTVNNIDSLASLTALNKLLKNLNAVDSFKMLKMNEKQVEVLVTLKGGLMSLENALNVQSNLKIDTSTAANFHYNWQP